MLSNTVTFYPGSKSIYELLCNEKYKTKKQNMITGDISNLPLLTLLSWNVSSLRNSVRVRSLKNWLRGIRIRIMWLLSSVSSMVSTGRRRYRYIKTSSMTVI